MIKRFGLVALWGILIFCGLTAWGQDASEAAVKLGSGATLKNTIIWGNKGKQVGDGVTGVNCYIQIPGKASPLFVDSLNNDFRLMKDSPCIGTGINDVLGTIFGSDALDLWGNKRFVDIIDIGANEYTFYKVYFDIPSDVVIESVRDADNCDSTHVEPGHAYQFKVDFSKIAGITADMVTVKMLTGDKELKPDINKVYTVSNINSDIYVVITLNPPIVVTVEIPGHGQLTAQGDKMTIPDKSVSPATSSMVVEENEVILLDTVSDPGYYCTDVWMKKTKSAEAKVSVKDKVGAGKGVRIGTEDITFSAAFSPRSYPVKLKVNDRMMGGLTVVNKKTAASYSLAAGVNEFSQAVEYASDLTFDIQVVKNTGYGIKSIKVYDIDGSSNPEDLTNATNKVADMRVGGMVVEVIYEPEQCIVSWHCTNGNLTLDKGGVPESITGGGYKVNLPYNTLITITPVGNTGYQYKTGTLTAQPTGETEQTVTDSKWMVTKNTVLSAEFEPKKYLVTITAQGLPADITDFYTTDPVLGADHMVTHGSGVVIHAKNPEGYTCKKITVNGVERGVENVTLSDIVVDKNVGLFFERKGYDITYVNVTPEYGDLTVALKDKDAAVWTPFAASPGKAYYGDAVKISTNAKTHYKLKSLKVKVGSDPEMELKDAGAYTLNKVESDVKVTAEFEPESYTVTLRKKSGAGLYPDKGAVRLVDQAGADRLMVAETVTTDVTAQVPYGTRLTMIPACVHGYSVTQLDTVVVSHPEGSILAEGGFVVTSDVTVLVGIENTTPQYTISWNIDEVVGSGNVLKVYKTTEGDIVKDAAYDVNTELKIEPVQAATDTLLYIRDQSGNNVASPYTLIRNTVLTAKFVRKCTVRIESPTGATITVSKDGTALADGAVVPAGAVLQAVITAADGAVGCETLAVDGNRLWTGTISTIVAPPSTSGNVNYTIPETHTGGEIWFRGTAEKYYKVKYTQSVYGSLGVVAGTDVLTAGTQYWYRQGTQVKIVATETEAGYQLNAAHKVVNNGVTPAEDILLSAVGTPATVYQYTYDALDRNLNLSTTFERKEYEVRLLLEGVATVPAGGSVQWTGGDVAVNTQGTTNVKHGDRLTCQVVAPAGFSVEIIHKPSEICKTGTGTFSYETSAVIQPEVYAVKFVKRYQVYYGTTVTKVTRENGTIVNNGDFVDAGGILKAYSATPPTGQECTQITVRKYDLPNNLYGNSLDADKKPDGTVEYTFTMPADDVRVEAEFEKLKYDLTLNLNAPVGAATPKVVKIEGGLDISVSAGTQVLSYGDVLKVTITLSPVTAGSLDTWFEVKSLTAKMGGRNVDLTSSSSDLDFVYSFTIPVTNHVDIAAEVVRRTKTLTVQVTPPDSDFKVKVQIDGGTPQYYQASYTRVQVPVGATVEAWVETGIGAPEGYELHLFPGTGRKETHILTTMPLNSELSLYAEFTLKQYPLNIVAIPQDGGSIMVTDTKGNNYTQGKYSVEHGTDLNQITALAADAYYHFDKITGYMGGVDRLLGQTSPYHVDHITDSVGIEAHFSRRYRIVRGTVTAGTLTIHEAGTATDAVGQYYAAGQSFAVKMTPVSEAYACTNAVVYFPGSTIASQPLTWDADGNATYTIPAGLAAKDVAFSVTFEKKEYRVTLKKLPAEGGEAEVWNGVNSGGGTLLLHLGQADVDTEVSVADVAHGSVLHFYTTPNAPDWEEAAKFTGANTPYTGAVTVMSDTLFTVYFGRLYTLTFGPNITVQAADGSKVYHSGDKIPEGKVLVTRAELTGHDCTSLTATKDGGAYLAWTDTDGDGSIEETFSMPAGDVDIQGTFQPKKFKVKIEHQPDIQAFNTLDVHVMPGGAAPNFKVDRANGSLAEYLSTLRLDLATLQLHPWYEGPVTVTAVMRGDPTVYDLQVNNVVVKDSVTITATAHRKNKQLNIVLQQESGASGNQVVVQLEDGTQHAFTADGSITVDVGAPVEIWTIDAEGCKTVLLSANDGITTPVTNAPFTLSLVNMPDFNVTVTARFEFKRYPVYYTTNPGGRLIVNKIFNGVAEGIVVHSGDEVKHFTELTVRVEPESQSWQLVPGSFITRMGGVAMTDPAYVASVSAAVNIDASFERIYEVRKETPDPTEGMLEVSRADTNAVGYRYPAGTTLKVKAEPQTGYEVVGLTMNGEAQTVLPEGGEVICTIPGGNLSVDSVVFRVEYALKKYDVTFVVKGEGTMEVNGLAGGVLQLASNSNKSRRTEHFTLLDVVVNPLSAAYLIESFTINRADGTSVSISGNQAAVEITGKTDIVVEFRKYYWITYEQSEHGVLNVMESGKGVGQYARYPGLTAFDVWVEPEEGYEVEDLTWNEGNVVNNTVMLPKEDALYDTVRIKARMRIIPCKLVVVQPDSGFIKVERMDEYGNWVSLDVSSPVTLDYWTQIRVKSDVYNPAGYEVKEVLVNGQPHPQGEIWTMRGEARVEAVVAPRLYTIDYADPQFGHLQIETPDGTVKPGDKVPYRTPLTIAVVPDDPEGYEVVEVKVNGQEIENEDFWIVLENTTISAVIKIRQWTVSSFVTGKGTLDLLLPDGTAVQSPSDIVDHYTILRIKPVADPAWKLYSLQIDGAEMQPDSTITVTRDAQVTAEFRERETYLFPVAFTPNGDGYNDNWEISGLWQAPENTLEIFNRDQQSLYKAAPYMNEWNGTTDNGKILPAGTYVYKFTDGQGGVYMGLVSIVRN